MTRTYNFDLPYTIGHLQVEFGIGQLQSDGIFTKLPVDIQNRLTAAAASWFDGVTVSQADLDSIDDATWQELAVKLNLTYTVSGTQTSPVDPTPALPSHKTVIGTTSSSINQ